MATQAVFRVAVPIVYVVVKYFHMKTTMPLGGTGPEVVTRAVKVTFCP